MTSPVSPTAGVENLSAIYGSSRPSAAESADAQSFLNAFDQGIGRLAARPDMREGLPPVEQMTSEYGGDVGSAKIEMVSGAQARAEELGQGEGTQVEDRLVSLYFELTHYQVAWRIVQNVQRDLSQVLRGS